MLQSNQKIVEPRHELDQRNIEFTLGPLKMVSFALERHNIKGVGRERLPFFNFDPYIDHSIDDELHEEVLLGLSRVKTLQPGMFYGAIPDEELQQGQSWSEQLRLIEQYDPTGEHRRRLEILFNTVPKEELVTTVYRYAYFAMNSPIPWFFNLRLKDNNFAGQQSRFGGLGEWTNDVVHFPKLKSYVEALPFKSISRVGILGTYPNTGVTVHRDANLAEHRDHNINLFFVSGRRTFLYDALKREKVYLDPSIRSYFSNNRDYHGVDPEPVFRYTVRVNGEFTDEMCEKIGLEDGYTWRWSYEK